MKREREHPTSPSPMPVAIPLGDPNGIGPEIVAKAALSSDLGCPIVVVGREWIVRRELALAGSSAELVKIEARDLDPLLMDSSGPRRVIPLIEAGTFREAELTPGRATPAGGIAARDFLLAAADLVRAGRADALCTPPINKEALRDGGWPGVGHTELLADHFAVDRDDVAMLLTSESLRVAHVSTHVSLRRAIELVSQDRIVRVGVLLAEAVAAMVGRRARVAVSGLNPHAGEDGLFGTEDRDIIRPAVDELVRSGVDAHGPLPPDTVFLAASNGRYDGAVAMYHDQGHIPSKLSGFVETVNVSLGLPIIRTSVDHGTAYDIVGKGVADEQNLVRAIRLASSMAANRSVVNH